MTESMTTTLDQFCGSKFWDLNTTWFTDKPHLSTCFQNTVLVWTPCLFLWIFAIMEVYYITHSRARDIPWNFKNVSKLLLKIVLLVVSVVDLSDALLRAEKGDRVYPVDVYTPIIKICTFLLAIVLLLYGKKYGLRTSGTLFMFWLLCAVLGIPQFRTAIREARRNKHTSYVFISCLSYYPTTVLLFLFNCFADKEPNHFDYLKSKNPCPLDNSSFLSRLWFSWFDCLTWKGYRKPLDYEDLWDLTHENTSEVIVPQFDKYWQTALEKAQRLPKPKQKKKASKPASDFEKPYVSIMPVLIKAFGPAFLFGSICKLCQDVLMFTNPQILRLLIAFAEEGEEQWKGYFYTFLLFSLTIAQTLFGTHYSYKMSVVGMRIKTALTSAIYRKTLRISSATKKKSTVGDIVNLMAVDTRKFVELMNHISLIWAAPLQIFLAAYFLWDLLGIAVLSGLVVMILMIPLNGFIARRIKILQMEQMENKDLRVKIMNEVLNGIKVLKLYAWEPSFEEKILRIRDKEIKLLKKIACLNVITSFIWYFAPVLVSLAAFATYVLIDDANVLDATTAFVSLSLLNILKHPLTFLPLMISNLVQAIVSVQRINKFLNSEEVSPNNVQHEPNQRYPILIENGNFDWGDGPVLKNINMRAKNSQLVAVVGGVGSGKSSLIAALLGEMNKTSGKVNTFGFIAHVAQEAWIQNNSLQNNILFGKPFDKKWYDKVVDACALRLDFDMLAAGDQTEIGEKGINLSGGQKQRVSLARAVYSNSDIVLLDDPLSAVDSHVGRHIFDNVIGPKGLLKKKTVILVTHGVTFLPDVDKIIVMKNGEISESGTYYQLLDKRGDFSEFLIQHITDIAEEQESGKIDEMMHSMKIDKVIDAVTKSTQQKHEKNKLLTNGDKRSYGAIARKRIKRDDSNYDKNKRNAFPELSKRNGDKLIEQERMETGSISWDVYKHYVKASGLCLTSGALLFNLLYQGFNAATNIWLSEWTSDKDVFVNGTVNVQKQNMYMYGYGGFGMAQAIMIFFSSGALFLGTLNGAATLHRLLLYKVIRAPCNTFFDVTPIGRILNRFSKDVDILDTILPMVVRGSTNCFFGALSVLFVICFSTPIFIAAIIPIGILYYYIQRFYILTSCQLQRLESVTCSPIYSHFGETITGTSTIKAYEKQETFIRDSEKKVEFNQRCYFPNMVSSRWLTIRLEMIGNIVVLFASLAAVIQENRNSGLIGLSITSALQVTVIFTWLVRLTSDLETNIVSVERIKEYDGIPQEAPWLIPKTAPIASWPDWGNIIFSNYALRYRPGLELVLRGLNFSIKGGEKVGIVGRTGAGKSSLTLSLFRLIEAAQGQIMIDGINVGTIGLHTLRSNLTIIPQDAVLFSGTLRYNLDPFDKYSDDEIWKALENAHLKSYIKGLPARLYHEITEAGGNLSVGQRQLVCLGRALLRKSKILILDEATAAIDLETDDLVQRTIRSEFKNSTVLTIAHRLNTIMDSDRVMVLDKGKLVEFDIPSNLLENNTSIFHSMAKDAGLI